MNPVTYIRDRGGEIQKRKFVEIKKNVNKLLIYMMLIFGGCFMIVPFLWMVSASLKFETQVFSFPIQWIPEPVRWENYKDIFSKVKFLTYYKNTLIITAITTFCQIFTCSLAAYSLARLKYRGRDKIFLAYLGTLMIPFQVVMIPQFVLMKQIGLTDDIWAVILISAFSPFGVFLFKQFFVTVPEELSEAGRIDGCSEFRIYRSIIMPLSKPAISSLTILTFVWSWNDFLKPLIYLSSDKNKTIQLGIRNFLSLYTSDYALLMAAATMSLLPMIIVFFCAQKSFIEGIAMTGIKG